MDEYSQAERPSTIDQNRWAFIWRLSSIMYICTKRVNAASIDRQSQDVSYPLLSLKDLKRAKQMPINCGTVYYNSRVNYRYWFDRALCRTADTNRLRRNNFGRVIWISPQFMQSACNTRAHPMYAIICVHRNANYNRPRHRHFEPRARLQTPPPATFIAFR